MNLLIIHQNYPGQYRESLKLLAGSGRHRIVFLTQRRDVASPADHSVVAYKPDETGTPARHPYVEMFDSSIRTAIGAMQACRQLKEKGFTPDLVIGHAGWGELIFVKEIWPQVPVLGYFEYYFIPKGGLVDSDPEFPASPDIAARLHARTAPAYLSLMRCDDGYTATAWQKQTFPEIFHPKIKVLHEGIRTDLLAPDHEGAEPLTIGSVTFRRGEEIVCYIARNLEPGRGFHTMLRALPRLQRERPNVRTAIVGSDGVSYGGRLAEGKTFRALFTEQLGDSVDWSRVHFLGQIPYPALIRLIQLARCHVYLTAPFVVSWSLLEAMALEKTVVTTDVAPVRQFVEHGRTGFLVDYFKPDDLGCRIAEVLSHPDNHRAIGKAARRHVVANYDFKGVCYPQLLGFMNRVLAKEKRIAP
jgi:glycosyltransferase involved in cell wall biosynthesis